MVYHPWLCCAGIGLSFITTVLLVTGWQILHINFHCVHWHSSTVIETFPTLILCSYDKMSGCRRIPWGLSWHFHHSRLIATGICRAIFPEGKEWSEDLCFGAWREEQEDADEDGSTFFHCFYGKGSLIRYSVQSELSLTPHKQVQNGHQHENFSISILPLTL